MAAVFRCGVSGVERVAEAGVDLIVAKEVPGEEIVGFKIIGEEVANKVNCKEESASDDGADQGAIT